MLITYESEALNARLNGQDIQYVIPRQTMLIELPIAVLKNSSNKDLANKFIRYVKGAAAQDLFAQYGFRPVESDGREEVRVEVPGAPGHLQDRRQDHRRLARSRQGLVRPEQGPHGRRSSSAIGGRPLASTHSAPVRDHDVAPSEGAAAAALSLGFVTAFLSVDRRACRSRRSSGRRSRPGCSRSGRS